MNNNELMSLTQLISHNSKLLEMGAALLLQKFQQELGNGKVEVTQPQDQPQAQLETATKTPFDGSDPYWTTPQREGPNQFASISEKRDFYNYLDSVQVSEKEVETIQVSSVFDMPDGTALIVSHNLTLGGWRLKTSDGRIYKNVVSTKKRVIAKWLKAYGGVIRLAQSRKVIMQPSEPTVVTTTNN